MVVSAKQNTHKSQVYQGNGASACSSAKINAFTSHGLCDTRMTAFGGLFPLIKFLKIVDFEQIISQHNTSPVRKTQLGCYKMLTGFIMLIFIGFQRINHFDYIRTDSLVCGFLRLAKLPAVSTFWRYLASLTYNQARSILRISRLKMLYISAKIVMHGNVTTIKYSTFDPRSYSLVDFLDFLDDRLSKQSRPLVSHSESGC